MPEHLPTSESLPYFWRLDVSTGGGQPVSAHGSRLHRRLRLVRRVLIDKAMPTAAAAIERKDIGRSSPLSLGRASTPGTSRAPALGGPLATARQEGPSHRFSYDGRSSLLLDANLSPDERR